MLFSLKFEFKNFSLNLKLVVSVISNFWIVSILFEKAKFYKQEFLATTFILENEEQTVAYYSIFNDSLKVEEEGFASKSAFKRFLKDLVSHPKRHLKSFPALKIGRLGIDKDFKGCYILKYPNRVEFHNKKEMYIIDFDEFFELNPKLKGKVRVIERPLLNELDLEAVQKEIQIRKEIRLESSEDF